MKALVEGRYRFVDDLLLERDAAGDLQSLEIREAVRDEVADELFHYRFNPLSFESQHSGRPARRGTPGVG